MKLVLVLALALMLAGAIFSAPTVTARPDPPQCVMEPCCAQGDLDCRIDWARRKLCDMLC